MRAAAAALLAGALLLLLLGPAATLAGSGRDGAKKPPASPPTISVGGVEVLSPSEVQTYRQAHVTYWRTVMSKSANASPANPAPVNPPANFACPKATEYDWSHGEYSKDGKDGQDKKKQDDTYLITGSLIAAGGIINRSCTLPSRRRVILNVLDDVEWYAPTIDYTQSSPQLVPKGVRLSPSSLRSLAQVNIGLANASACVYATINGTEVPRITSFFHVSPYVPDMDISAGFFQVVRQVNNINVTGDKAAQDLLRKGKNNTDFADAGYYLIFPSGLPRGRHTFRFGLRAGCSLAAGRTFFREGTKFNATEDGAGHKDDGGRDDNGRKDEGRKDDGRKDEGRKDDGRKDSKEEGRKEEDRKDGGRKDVGRKADEGRTDSKDAGRTDSKDEGRKDGKDEGRKDEGRKYGKDEGRKDEGRKDEGKGYPAWWHDGKEGGECWPYPDSCGTDCVAQEASEVPSFGWEYVITVTDKK